jgi:hypothetical protein
MAGLVNKPIDWTLRHAGVDFQFGSPPLLELNPYERSAAYALEIVTAVDAFILKGPALARGLLSGSAWLRGVVTGSEAEGSLAGARVASRETSEIGEHVAATGRRAGALLDGQELRSVGTNLNRGTGAYNDVFVAEAASGERVAVRVSKDPNRYITVEREAANVKALEAYGGPRYRGRVTIRDATGAVREGVAMDIVDGTDLASIYKGTWNADFLITERHVDSMKKLFARLEADGKVLDDVSPGNFVLTREGGVVPIDNTPVPIEESGKWASVARMTQQRHLAKLRDLAVGLGK